MLKRNEEVKTPSSFFYFLKVVRTELNKSEIEDLGKYFKTAGNINSDIDVKDNTFEIWNNSYTGVATFIFYDKKFDNKFILSSEFIKKAFKHLKSSEDKLIRIGENNIYVEGSNFSTSHSLYESTGYDSPDIDTYSLVQELKKVKVDLKKLKKVISAGTNITGNDTFELILEGKRLKVVVKTKSSLFEEVLELSESVSDKEVRSMFDKKIVNKFWDNDADEIFVGDDKPLVLRNKTETGVDWRVVAPKIKEE